MGCGGYDVGGDSHLPGGLAGGVRDEVAVVDDRPVEQVRLLRAQHRSAGSLENGTHRACPHAGHPAAE
jgi:hypothetical protein